MSWTSRPSAWAALLLVAALVPASAAAQSAREFSLWGVSAFSRPAVHAGGLGLAWRDRGRTRVGLGLAIGTSDRGALAGRAEASYHFLLDPARRAGTAVYAGGGVVVSAAGDGRLRPFALVVVGAERAPASGRGTFIEAGVGGGARLALGMRWRKRNAPSR